VLDFPEEVLQFKVRGKEYEVNKPTNGDIKQYRKNLSGCDTDEKKEEALRDFMKSLGLEDVGVLDVLTPKQSERLIASLYDTEKN
jgi:hypothetical protein